MATEKSASYWLTFVRLTYAPEEAQPVPEVSKSEAGNTQNGVRDSHLDTHNDGNLNATFDATGNGSRSEPTQKEASNSANLHTSNNFSVDNGTSHQTQVERQDDTSNNDATISRWWWTGTQKDSIKDVTTAEDRHLESWARWFLYGSVTTVVDLLYKRDEPEPEPRQNKPEPFAEASSTWFPWFRTAEPENDDSDNYSVNGADLIKTARTAIETPKDTTHYAFKYGAADELLLSVSETRSETQPVRYKSRKRPRTQNEVQEMLLQPQSVTIRSSNSSIRSENTHIIPDDKPVFPHIIFPSLEENYRIITVRTQVRLLGQHLLYHANSSECHLYRRTEAKIVRRKKKTKKAVVIGVHNFLPTKMVKTTIGQSTGNSIKFVKEASKAIRAWLLNEECDIETIALDGGGKVADRVEHLLKLLGNWYQLISDADFLFVVAHSQGVTVGIQVLAGLLERVDWRNKRIGFLSMAGPFHGPVVGLDTKLVVRAYSQVENEVIRELFDLQKPSSDQTQLLKNALATLLEKNVKVTLCGSFSDQFVPLFSSLATGYTHPNIYRIIHSRLSENVPPFIILLFQAAVIAKNMGRSDYNVIQDLSDRCVGSLSTGGHGHVFEDQAVYVQALQHALETTDLFQHKHLQHAAPQLSKVPNPYQIPWNIRTLLNEILQLHNNASLVLVTQLIIAFKKWAPTSKPWKELKYALDAFEEASLQDFNV